MRSWLCCVLRPNLYVCRTVLPLSQQRQKVFCVARVFFDFPGATVCTYSAEKRSTHVRRPIYSAGRYIARTEAGRPAALCKHYSLTVQGSVRSVVRAGGETGEETNQGRASLRPRSHQAGLLWGGGRSAMESISDRQRKRSFLRRTLAWMKQPKSPIRSF